jgi:hypothetical protein
MRWGGGGGIDAQERLVGVGERAPASNRRRLWVASPPQSCGRRGPLQRRCEFEYRMVGGETPLLKSGGHRTSSTPGAQATCSRPGWHRLQDASTFSRLQGDVNMSAEYRRQDAIRNETAFDATIDGGRIAVPRHHSRAAKLRGRSRNTLIARTDQHGLARPLRRRERS